MPGKTKGSVWQTALILLISACVIGGITYAAIRLRPEGEQWTGGGAVPEGRFCASSCPDCPTNISLPPSAPLPIPKLSKDTSPWFISTNIQAETRLSIDQNTATTENFNSTTAATILKVDYALFTWSTASGAEFKANPNNALPSDSAVLRYSVYFPPDFPWTKGGKLPGFCISDTVEGCATGARWSNSSGSVRVMFRQDGRAIGYVYIPLQVAGVGPGHDGLVAVSAVQGADFQKIANLPAGSLTGFDLWCKASGGLQFVAGEWNDVVLVIKMNDLGQKNGGVSLTVNNQTREVNDILWRVDENIGVNQLLFATFFGGSDSGWMIKEPTFSYFRNFGFAAPVADSLEPAAPPPITGPTT
jgi:hypothetical protein